MELNMGTKIALLRRKRGMTQEQLAAVLGVSAPAVSKWETDSSYPDITLLCPLARALGTDVDNLLTFEEELSQEKLGRYMADIIEMIRQGQMSQAEEKLNALLRTYPSDMPLKFSAIAALSFLEMNSNWGDSGEEETETSREACGPKGIKGGEEDRKRWSKRKKELARALHDDGNPAYYLSSVSMLVSLALEEGELEEAERLLKENMANTADFTALWVRLHLKRGDRDQALGVLQRQTYKLVTDLRTCLMHLMSEDMGLERDRVIGICGILEQLDSLFSVGGYTGAGLSAEVYLRIGEQERALEYLEQMADQIAGQAALPNPLVFAPAITPKELTWSREMKLAILRGLEKDACFEPLRSLERYRALVQKVKNSLDDYT